MTIPPLRPATQGPTAETLKPQIKISPSWASNSKGDGKPAESRNKKRSTNVQPLRKGLPDL